MATPVVFVHGLWLHADSWGARVDRFREAGYAPAAPGGAVTDYREFADRGHSLGIDSGEHDVVDAVLAWLGEHGL